MHVIVGGAHDDIKVTLTIIAMDALQENDQIYLEMLFDKDIAKPASSIHSIDSFIGMKI